MAEAREEETWVVKGEAWAKKASQLLFWVGSLVAPVGFFGVSSGYPSLLARPLVVKVG